MSHFFRKIFAMKLSAVFIKITNLKNHAKKLVILIVSGLMLASCANFLQKPANDAMTSAMSDTQITSEEVAENKFSYSTEKLHIALIKAFSKEISDNNLQQYDLYLQKYLENEFDGTTNYFQTSDRNLTANFTMTESFKIIPQNIYCREYKQHVEYMGEVIDNIGVACRENRNIWKNIVLLTQ